MRIPLRRLFTDENGTSRIVDVEAELDQGFTVPQSASLFSSPFVEAVSSFWIGAPTGWAGAEPHPAPRRMLLVTVRGEYEIGVADGVAHRFPPGSVLIMEDTTGDGHTTAVVSAEDLSVFAVGLAPDYDWRQMLKPPAMAATP
jgi:hypothetical protein